MCCKLSSPGELSVRDKDYEMKCHEVLSILSYIILFDGYKEVAFRWYPPAHVGIGGQWKESGSW